jgi:hypothetical protein
VTDLAPEELEHLDDAMSDGHAMPVSRPMGLRIRHVHTVGVLVSSWLALACGGGGPEFPPPPVNRSFAVLDGNRLYRDDRSPMDSMRVAISDTETLRRLWEQATAETPPPKPPVPAIDFSTDMVLLVSAGRRNSGDRIRIDSVGSEFRAQPDGRSSEVWFAVVRTIPDCNPFPGFAYPLELVRIQRVQGTFDFKERVAACP